MKEERTNPPGLFLRLFRWSCKPGLVDFIEGDLLEVYRRRLSENGKWQADFLFALDIILLVRPGIIKPIIINQNSNLFSMYANHLKFGWRNIVHKRTYSFVNVLGLSLGITCALLIFSLIDYHLSFDNFHQDADRIYRFVTEQHRDEVSYASSVPPAFGKTFKDDYTFAEKVARVCYASGIITLDGHGELKKFAERAAFADPEFFDIFNFNLVGGVRKDVLREQNSAIVTEEIARKYFGNESAIGKTFQFDNRIDFTITGILKDLPENTDFRSEIFFSYSTIKQYNDWYAADDAWGGITTDIQTFARLRPGMSIVEIESVLPEYVKRFRPKSKNVHHYKLQPLKEAHFDSRYGGVMDRKIIYVLIGVGFFLVFTACLNFINLATAQAANRSKEVGIRKALGSVRAQLFTQFTMETGIIVFLAGLLALGAAYSLIPVLNEFSQSHISIGLFTDVNFLMFFLVLMFTVTFVSGSYPGVVLSRYKPVQALKGKLTKSTQGNFNVRRGLIVVQFVISQILLVGLIVILSQMKLFKTIDMGFNHQAIVMVPTGSGDIKRKTLRDQFLQVSNVKNVSLCFAAPSSNSSWTTTFTYDNRTEMENFAVSFRGADENYLNTFDIDLVAGRNITPSDTVREYMVNRTFVKKLGILSPEDVLGKPIEVNGWIGSIVGVVNDFHDRSLHSEINPIVITTSAENYHEFAIRISTNDVGNTLASLEKLWTEMYPHQIYEYAFLDDQIASFYKAEEAMLTLIKVFSSIALFIGCLGLYGLVSFMAVQRTKEIGIRKVLGGTVTHILLIFGKEFTGLVVVAFVIATPISWYLMSRWLTLYAFKIDLSVWIFLLNLSVIFLMVMLTVGYRSLKTATANPVDSLRTE